MPLFVHWGRVLALLQASHKSSINIAGKLVHKQCTRLGHSSMEVLLAVRNRGKLLPDKHTVALLRGSMTGTRKPLVQGANSGDVLRRVSCPGRHGKDAQQTHDIANCGNRTAQRTYQPKPWHLGRLESTRRLVVLQSTLYGTPDSASGWTFTP